MISGSGLLTHTEPPGRPAPRSAVTRDGIFILCLDLALSDVRFTSVSRSTERRPEQATGPIATQMDEAS
jgi:hypothetical protein